MDRFIDVINLLANYNTEILKSNMDRFIVLFRSPSLSSFQFLKSNMDRFIDYTYYCITELENFFKIQYG